MDGLLIHNTILSSKAGFDTSTYSLLLKGTVHYSASTFEHLSIGEFKEVSTRDIMSTMSANTTFSSLCLSYKVQF